MAEAADNISTSNSRGEVEENVVSISAKLTNRDVYEFYKTNKDSVSHTELVNLFLQKFCVETKAQPTTFYNKMKEVYQKLTNKLRAKEKREKFLESEFNIPVSKLERATQHDTPRKAALKKELFAKKRENKTLKRKVLSLETETEEMGQEYSDLLGAYHNNIEDLLAVSESYRQATVDHEKDHEKLRIELQALQKQFDKKSEELDAISVKLAASKKMSPVAVGKNVKNLKRQVKRSKIIIDKKKDELQENRNKIVSLQEEAEKKNAEIIAAKQKLQSMKTELEENENKTKLLKVQRKTLQTKLSNLKKKCHNKDKKILNLEEDNLLKIDLLEEKIKKLREENVELEKLLALAEDPEIQTLTDDGKYTDEVREVIMDLISYNVALRQIDSVIRTVLRKFANKEVLTLPSLGLKSRLSLEARHIADYQVGQTMLQGGNTSELIGNCLHGDGTTKFAQHYQSFQVTSKEGNSLSFGMMKLGGQTADDLTEALVQKFEDIAHALAMDDADLRKEIIKQLIVSITSTMSDRAAVNTAFNREFDELRSRVIPDVVANWETLTEDEKQSLMNVGHYFCGLHLIVNFAEEAAKALKSAEGAMLEGKNPFTFDNSECGTFRLLRTACKAFEEHGSDEAGVASHFDAFLKGKGEDMHLVSWRGNRINIAFYNATALYYHKDHLVEFLEKWPNANRLLKSVYVDIKVPVYLAGIRALGVIDKIVTGPLWRLLESDIGVLAMGPHYHQLQLSLLRWMDDSSSLLSGEAVFSEEIAPIHRDKLYDSLFMEHDEEFVDLTEQILEILCAHLLLLLERQAADHLPGGKFHQPPNNQNEQTVNVPKTNIVSERDFAQLDLQLRVKPSARIETHEALVMWRNNKTSTWLDGLGSQEKEKLFEDARKSARTWIMDEHKKRQASVLEKRQKHLKERQRKKEVALQKEVESKAELVRVTNNLAMTCGGVWTSEAEVDEYLHNLESVDEAKNCVLLQLKFHKLAGSKAPKQFYFQAETRAGGTHKIFDTETLVQHLKEVIIMNVPTDDTHDYGTNQPIRRRDNWEEVAEQEKIKVLSKLKEARTKRKATSCQQMFENYCDDPTLLINSKIKHRIKDTEDDIPDWYLGTVVGIENGHIPRNKLRTFFLVKYDVDGDDEQFRAPLLSDLKRGDLIIL